jgi:hypothetical protein
MFDDAALALEEIEPEDKTRKEVFGGHSEGVSCIKRMP